MLVSHRAFLSVVVALGLVASFASSGSEAVAAEVSETVPVRPFHSVRIDGDADVTLRAGDRETVTVVIPERQRHDLLIAVENGELRIGPRDEEQSGVHFFVRDRKAPRITITFRTLDTVQLSGAVKLHADTLRTPHLAISASGAASIDVDNIRADQMRIDGSGAFKATLGGRVARQDIVISGAGKYHSPDLVSDDARVEVSGAGHVFVNAGKRLQIRSSGAGSVEYVGDPQVIKEISGVGRVRRHSASDAGSSRTG